MHVDSYAAMLCISAKSSVFNVISKDDAKEKTRLDCCGSIVLIVVLHLAAYFDTNLTFNFSCMGPMKNSIKMWIVTVV